MNSGEWVFTSHNGNKITGFVTETFANRAVISVTIPSGYGQISMPFDRLCSLNDTVLGPDDISALIDLSLAIRDEAWFRKWVYELSLWKPASVIQELNAAP